MGARPWPLPPGDAPLIHHVTDTHFGYRQWSFAEGDHMLRDMRQGLIPPPAAMVHTGDIIDDVSEFGGVSPLSTQDNYALNWLNQADAGVPSLWVPGNHDLWDRPGRLRSEWEAAYGRPGNSYLDVAGYRIVGFAPSLHTSPDNVWAVDTATWTWLDSVCGTTANPVVLADHYPPAEVDAQNYISPEASLAGLVSAHPNIVGLLCGHEHYAITNPKAASFVALGNRAAFPVVSSPSAVFAENISSRDQSARVPTISAYISLYPDRWQVRYRMHGKHAWEGPGGLRVTTMNLTAGTVTHGMQ